VSVFLRRWFRPPSVVRITNVQFETDRPIYLLVVAYDPLREEIGSWRELGGSSQASSYRAYSDYESSRVNERP